jgi:catechol 2,3-dioxygenase-like lactoylglutathione lyase family enzyme
MKPKISLITLGVSDLVRSRTFYQKLGLPLRPESNEHVAFFECEGTWVGLFPREELAKDATVPGEGSGFSGFSLAHNVASPEDVDATLAFAVSCGARLVKSGQKVFWGGYSGYFEDPDGFLWEVAHNPLMDLT